jgi:hypothetical protein
MSSTNINTNNSNIKPSPEDMEIIFNYMIENNLSSYSDRADCVDDGPDLGEWPADNSAFTQENVATSSAERGGFQSPRPPSHKTPEFVPVLTREQLVDATVQKIAGEVNAFFQRKANGNLTEQDKERIWRDGTDEERSDLGEWRPPAVSSLPPLSQRIQRALAGFAALEKECAEKGSLLNYNDDALYD